MQPQTHAPGSPVRIITFGTFDLFHIGHLRIIQRARELGSELVVGVSSDELNFSKKGSYPVYDQDERMAIVAALRDVDEVFLEESLDLKREYIQSHAAHILVMGDDWRGKFDAMSDVCKVHYLERTPNISTTLVKAEIFHAAKHGAAADAQ